jgi:thioredoxin-like negative regulator of GroEL
MKRFEGQATFVRVDVDETKDVATEYKTNAVPTQVMFWDRAEVARVRGASTDALREMVLKNLA